MWFTHLCLSLSLLLSLPLYLSCLSLYRTHAHTHTHTHTHTHNTTHTLKAVSDECRCVGAHTAAGEWWVLGEPVPYPLVTWQCSFHDTNYPEEKAASEIQALIFHGLAKRSLTKHLTFTSGSEVARWKIPVIRLFRKAPPQHGWFMCARRRGSFAFAIRLFDILDCKRGRELRTRHVQSDHSRLISYSHFLTMVLFISGVSSSWSYTAEIQKYSWPCQMCRCNMGVQDNCPVMRALTVCSSLVCLHGLRHASNGIHLHSTAFGLACIQYR